MGMFFRRFDDVFAIPLPGKAEIEKLLKMTLSSVRMDRPIAWEPLIAKLKVLVGRDGREGRSGRRQGCCAGRPPVARQAAQGCRRGQRQHDVAQRA